MRVPVRDRGQTVVRGLQSGWHHHLALEGKYVKAAECYIWGRLEALSETGTTPAPPQSASESNKSAFGWTTEQTTGRAARGRCGKSRQLAFDHVHNNKERLVRGGCTIHNALINQKK